MSKTIIIRAADSSMAMDEVVRQLGPDALILSTTRRNGMVEIEATLEDETEKADKQQAGQLEADAVIASASDSKSLLETAPSTFEALLKRRLEEDKVDALVTAARQAAEGMTPSEPPLPPLPEPETDLRPAPEDRRPGAEPMPQPQPEQKHEPVPDKRPDARSEREMPIPESRVIGLGAFDIPIPALAPHVIEAVNEDLDYFDRSFQLIGLSKAIVSSLVPERPTEALGAGRFWLAGPDMRQKALAAIRLATRKLDAGEEKPAFYVMGSEARADAAFLASKAELLGLTVSLVDESVGRNLPDNVPGSQIVLLPDNAEHAREYAHKFEHDGDKGVLVLPTVYGRRTLETVLQGWTGMDVQLMLCSPEHEPVPAELVACLLQFNWQTAWVSEGEEILDNLTQVNAETVIDWMRGWIAAPNETAAPQGAPLFHSRQTAPQRKFE
ncbi:hypothetical protein TG4357_02474 [Thalassovita gelatinovora]|uniref:Uncharacterized protein n=1 Tax=Thalassovita gelatinovora TaxID=53501 RepID=A0A0P1FET5_THAGE|nr:hypothetical protein [Thalassovita gelatinovora]QIZ79615.1 hypothetical protein HFZ77_03530 [Thalassovita gelatinovora]CUH66541.1 hypothetical protein TG4357_02474 [Thalassovita gelatinovora]SEQ37607.1 hypothetical protein SAMN04488043_10510 [Thalassovita gelatinovora]